MNGTVIFATVAVIFIIFKLTGFVNELHDDVGVKHKFGEEQIDNIDAEYYKTDIVGDKILVLDGLSDSKKSEVWQRSEFKTEMLSLYPDFDKMIYLINEKIVESSGFKQGLLDKIEDIQEKYISGDISKESAVATLSN
jgi:hypothetical protein